jgi:hypothetical protein
MLKINLILGTVSAAGWGNLQETILMVELLGDHFMIMQEAWELLENKYQQLILLSIEKSTVVVP